MAQPAPPSPPISTGASIHPTLTTIHPHTPSNPINSSPIPTTQQITLPSPSTAPQGAWDGSNNNNNSISIENGANTNDGSQDESTTYQFMGGYIYVVLVVALLVAVFYFGRAYLERRRLRRRLKEIDCEDPPLYLEHLHDVQVVDAYSLSPSRHDIVSGHRTLGPCPNTHSSSSAADMDDVVLVLPLPDAVHHRHSLQRIAPPAIILYSTTDPDPPAYEDLVPISTFSTRPTSTSLPSVRSSSLPSPHPPSSPPISYTLLSNTSSQTQSSDSSTSSHHPTSRTN